MFLMETKQLIEITWSTYTKYYMHKLGTSIKYNILYSAESDLALLIGVKVGVVTQIFHFFFFFK